MNSEHFEGRQEMLGQEETLKRVAERVNNLNTILKMHSETGGRFTTEGLVAAEERLKEVERQLVYSLLVEPQKGSLEQARQMGRDMKRVATNPTEGTAVHPGMEEWAQHNIGSSYEAVGGNLDLEGYEDLLKSLQKKQKAKSSELF